MENHLGAGRYRLIWPAVAALAGWALIRLFGLDGDTSLAPLMAFTPWVTLAALFLLGLAAAVKNWAAGAITCLSVAVLALAVLPRAMGSAEAAPEGAPAVTVLSTNVYKGNADPAAVVDLVRRLRPDILAVQELSGAYDRALRDAGIERLLPRSIVLLRLPNLPNLPDKQKRRPGIGVYSDLDIRRLPRAATTASSRLEATLPGGQKLRLVNFHPLTPSFDHVDRWQETQESLPSAGTGAPWLLVGDFNATLDQSALADVVDRGYRDAAEVTGDGLEMTWPADRRTPPLVAIDHVLADERLGIADFGVEDVPGSDHRAVWATVFLKPRP